MKNTALLISSIIISIFLCEIVIRLATPFPVTDESNKADDPVLGYRLSPQLDDVDEHGFRNKQMDDYGIAAIGDSHTYGVNVTSEHSWPSLLSKKTGNKVYNFGVGSYGILTYHAILKTLVNPDTESVIIGLYPANDFEMKNSFCKINSGESSFWNNEIKTLGLIIPSAELSGKYCKKKGKNTFSRLKNYIVDNSAIISATKFLVINRLKSNLRELRRKDENYYFFDGHDQIHPISRTRTKSHAKKMDINNTDTKSMYNNLEIFCKSWKKWADQTNTKIGILIIPSMERVIYEYFLRDNNIELLDKNFISELGIQIEFEKSLSELFNASNIPHINALDNIVNKLALSIQQKQEFYPPDNGHPLETGYEAYAESAYELWEIMNNDRQ